jgi:acyl carrier protein
MPPSDSPRTLRERLLDLVKSSNPSLDGDLAEHTSLIQSGILDSLGLFNLALLIERELGSPLDITAFDLSREWDTIRDIERFVAWHRPGGPERRRRAFP